MASARRSRSPGSRLLEPASSDAIWTAWMAQVFESWRTGCLGMNLLGRVKTCLNRRVTRTYASRCRKRVERRKCGPSPDPGAGPGHHQHPGDPVRPRRPPLAEASGRSPRAIPPTAGSSTTPTRSTPPAWRCCAKLSPRLAATWPEVAAIGITNQRETVVIWDKATGRPIHPAIVWQDRRTAEVCATLKGAGHEPRVTEVTGLLLDPYFSGTKIAWLLDKVPGAAPGPRRRTAGGTMDCWVIWKLTGGAVHATDATNASRTLLFDIGAQAWSAEMLDAVGGPGGPAARGAGLRRRLRRDESRPAGPRRPDPRRGRRPAGGADGAGVCGRPGQMKATYGTGCFMLINTGETAPISRSRLLTTVAARVERRTTYALEGSIFIAGAAIQWLAEGLGLAGGPQAAEALAQRRQARPRRGAGAGLHRPGRAVVGRRCARRHLRPDP
jgi:glycerol kinase